MRRLLLLAALAAIVRGQEPEAAEIRVNSAPYRLRPQFTLKVDAKLVEVGAVVRDARGHTVAGLTKEDFEITDEGRKRSITAFAVETSVPVAAASTLTGERPAAVPAKVSQRYVGLLFDDLSMGPRELPQAQSAAKRFVKSGLTAGDHVALFTTSELQNLPFTTDPDKLLEAIGKLHLNSRTPDGGMCPGMTAYEAYVIANRIDVQTFNAKLAEAANCRHQAPPADVTNFDGGVMRGNGRARPGPARDLLQSVKSQASAIWEQVRQTAENTMGAIADVVDLMAQMPEKRMVLLASSGFLSGTLEDQLDEITRHALHAGVVINALDAKGLYADEPGQTPMGADPRTLTRMQSMGSIAKEAGNDAVASLAYNTGGLFFHNNNDLDLGFHELGVRPEVSYLLGFSPEEAQDGKYHKLKVRLTASSHNTVQARLGYMAVPPAPAKPAAERRIDTEALATDTLQEVPIAISTAPAKTETGETALKAVFHLDIKNLRFNEQFGIRQQKILMVAVLADADGNFVTGKEGTMTLAVKEPTFNQLSANGINATLTLVAPPGTYRMRAVLQEDLEGKVTASTQTVEIR